MSFLATPTDVFAVPGEAVDASVQAYADRRTSKVLRGPLRTLSGGRLLRRNYVPGEDPGINDSVVLQQGPNYLLAKRIQRWRATSARAQGATVSFKIAPPTRTRSVVKNRALAAAYAGAHRFGVEVFDPGTANTLMAALLVHDLSRRARPARSTRGRTRRMPRRTAACGARPTTRAARSGWPPCSAPPPPAPDPPDDLAVSAEVVARTTTSALSARNSRPDPHLTAVPACGNRGRGTGSHPS